MLCRKEGNVLFNDALNTFYLWLYGIRHMVEDHSDCERGNPLLPHGILLLNSSKGAFICIIPQTGQHIPHTLSHQLWSTRNSSMGPQWSITPKTHCTISKRSYHRATSCSLVRIISIVLKLNNSTLRNNSLNTITRSQCLQLFIKL